MRRWWLVIALLLSLGVNLGILATLAGHRWGNKPPAKPPAGEQIPLPNGGGGAPARVIRLADQLGLEGDQRKRFIALQGKFFVETVQLRTEQAEVQRALRRELATAHPDQTRIDALLQDSGRVFLGLEKAMARNVVDSRQLLNADQERKFLRILARLRPGGGRQGQGQGEGQGQQRRSRRPPPEEPPPGEAPPPPGNAPPRGDDGEDAQEGPGQDMAPGRPAGEEAEAPPFRPRRQGMGQEGRRNRRLGGLGGRRGQGRRFDGQQPPPGPPQ